jgi:hypothetical protein
MSGGGGTTTNTTTSSSDPWSGAQPVLNYTNDKALDYMKDGTGADVYTDSTVTPMDSNSTAGYEYLSGMSNDNMNGNGLSGQYQGIIDGGGYNSEQQNALNNIQATANMDPYDILNNETYQTIHQNALDGAKNNSNRAAMAGGFFGNSDHNYSTNKAVYDASAGTAMSAINSELARKDAATNSLFNMGQQGQNNLATTFDNMQGIADPALTAGAAYEDLASRQIADDVRIFDAQQNADWNALARGNAIAGGASGFGTSSSTATQPSQNNTLGTAAGLGMLGSSLFF